MTLDDALNDAFDEKLKAAFASAQAPLDEHAQADAFSAKVIKKLGNPNRKKALILGGAGSTGSAIAGTQMEGLMGTIRIPTEGAHWMLATFASPEVLAAAVIAVTVSAVAIILPRQLLS
jgi:hypothetical protein